MSIQLDRRGPALRPGNDICFELSLDEAGNADKKLTGLAESLINVKALEMADKEP